MAFEDTHEVKLDSLYQEVILDHYRSPRNRGEIASPDVSAEGYNPLCGDEIVVQLALDGDRITQARFQARGCSISQASASMMAKMIEGRTVAEALDLAESFKGMMQGQPADYETMGDLVALEGVRHFPVRVKCALLAWETLKEGVSRRGK
jgi:nitrogen fixation NifU-like protein